MSTPRVHPDWLVATGLPAGVGGLMTTRAGGVSRPPFDTMNLRPPGLRGDAVDDPAAAIENQRRLADAIGAVPVWLDQVHGAECVRLTAATAAAQAAGAPLPRADAAVTTESGIACAVLVADCLPVLLAAPQGHAVAAAHAGWRGLAGGVVERTVAAVCEAAGCPPADLRAWLGACIGPSAFEVGADVLAAFGVDPDWVDAGVAAERPAAGCFVRAPRPDGTQRWRADLPALAFQRLIACGLAPAAVTGAQACTVGDASRYFSYRRDRVTGRMAACIWRAGGGAGPAA